MTVPTPNLDKMVQCRDKAAIVQEFIDWLLDEAGDTRLYIDNDTIFSDHQREALMGRFFGIDPREAERERMSILDDIRETHRQERVIKRRKTTA